ncbi:hypothetical protein CWO91_33430 [Bradyrhizobium genosp. SA-3]|nr:hypothetical protein CWO91_33430 [Bradyrhizobium genosp. SA-3]
MVLDTADHAQWLKQYYFLRAAFSVAWVIAAFAIAPSSASRQARPIPQGRCRKTQGNGGRGPEADAGR